MDLVDELIVEADTKIVLMVLDGLGGVRGARRRSELAEATTENFDRLAKEGSCGVHHPVAVGITPGSGAAHLALFGYDPLDYRPGRGALSAAGVDFELHRGDVAARVNFCTLDSDGLVVDRRAGRIPTEENQRLCEWIIKGIDLGGRAEVFLQTELEYRALLVLRGDELSPEIEDTDPQTTGVAPLEPRARTPAAEPTARILRELLAQVRGLLEGEQANFVLLRGFDGPADLPSFQSRYRMRAQAVAGYPMYRGIARILGMDVAAPTSIGDAPAALLEAWEEHDFFFVHHKAPDSAGEDGDFTGKVAAIEEADAVVPALLDLRPDVVCVTGDHSTPAPLRGHSWHPVPFLVWGETVGVDPAETFDEEAARGGAFGAILGKQIMPLLLSASGRLRKFGA